jgi:Sugar (and other) transporter
MIVNVFVLCMKTTNHSIIIVVPYQPTHSPFFPTPPNVIVSEYLPVGKRGKILTTLNYAWQFGQLLIILFAYLTLGTGGDFTGGGGDGDGESGSDGDLNINTPENNRPWKIFVILAASPTIIAIVMSYLYVPESPRWLLSKGRTGDALKTLRHVATMNGHDANTIFPLDQTNLVEGKENEEGNICELIKPAWRNITLLIVIVWSISGFFYFGAIQIATDISSSSSSSESTSSSSSSDNEQYDYYYTLDYIPIVFGAVFEAFSQVFPTLFIDTIGRKPFQTVSYFVAAMAMLSYGLMPSSSTSSLHIGQETMIIVTRMAGSVTFVTMSVQISELLPTSLRGKGHGLASLCQRMGGLASPYLVQSSTLGRGWTGGIIAATCLVALTAVCFLPETKKQIFGGVVEHIVVSEQQQDNDDVNDEEIGREIIRNVNKHVTTSRLQSSIASSE